MTIAIMLKRFRAVRDVEFADPHTGRKHSIKANRGGFFNPLAVQHLVAKGDMIEVPEQRNPPGGYQLPSSFERRGWT